jgi:hypothetical protein
MARKTNRRKYLILGADVARLAKLKWSTYCWWVWRSRFVWDATGKVKLRRSKHQLTPVKGKRYSVEAVWDVNDFLQYNPEIFRRLGTQNAWTRLHYDLNDFDD